MDHIKWESLELWICPGIQSLRIQTFWPWRPSFASVAALWRILLPAEQITAAHSVKSVIQNQPLVTKLMHVLGKGIAFLDSVQLPTSNAFKSHHMDHIKWESLELWICSGISQSLRIQTFWPWRPCFASVAELWRIPFPAEQLSLTIWTI